MKSCCLRRLAPRAGVRTRRCGALCWSPARARPRAQRVPRTSLAGPAAQFFTIGAAQSGSGRTEGLRVSRPLHHRASAVGRAPCRGLSRPAAIRAPYRWATASPCHCLSRASVDSQVHFRGAISVHVLLCSCQGDRVEAAQSCCQQEGADIGMTRAIYFLPIWRCNSVHASAAREPAVNHTKIVEMLW